MAIGCWAWTIWMRIGKRSKLYRMGHQANCTKGDFTMIDRRTFLRGAAIAPVMLAMPHLSLAQNADSKPVFDIAGSAQTDPAGFEIAWSNLWTSVDVGP